MTAAYLTAALVLAALLPLLEIAGQLHLASQPRPQPNATHPRRTLVAATRRHSGTTAPRARFRWAGPNWRHTAILAAHYDFGGKVVRLPAAPRITVEELLGVAA